MNSDSIRRAAERAQFIQELIREAERTGMVTIPDLPHGMDDPPESPLLEALRHLEEATAAHENRRPHMVAPGTLRGEIKKLCAERGWEIEFDIRRYQHRITAPLKSMDCPACHGTGKKPVWISVLQTPYDGSQVIPFVLCETCAGAGKIETRKTA